MSVAEDLENYTQEQIQTEFMRCRQSFAYWAKKYAKVTHPIRGLVPFILFPYQERCVKAFESHQFNILRKFRQAGLTTLAELWSLWRCLFKLDQRIMTLAKTDREAIGVSKIVEVAMESLPSWMQPRMKNNNDREREFGDTNSVMWFYTANAARSKALTYLIIDEAAFIPNMDEHWKAMYPTLSTGGNCIVVSTVHGVGNWYADTYFKAKDGKNLFNIIELDYREHPDYCKPGWDTKMKAQLGEKGFRQEVLGDFLGAGDTFVPPEVLGEIKKGCVSPIRKTYEQWDDSTFDDQDASANDQYTRGALWVWKEPERNHEYIIAADPAEGVGGEGDGSCFHVFDVTTFEQAAEFNSNTIKPHEFAQVLYQVGTFYNAATVAVENTLGPGMAVCNRLEHTLFYENLYYTPTGASEKIGVPLNKNIRPLCLETMLTCFMGRLVKVNSERLHRQLSVFVHNKKTKKIAAQDNHHDDLVIAWAIAVYVADVLNRQVPAGIDLGIKEVIGESLKGEDFQNLWNELEEGLTAELMAEAPQKDVDLMPFYQSSKRFMRPNDAMLRSFGW